MSFEIMKLPCVCDEVTFEVMALHERLMVEVRDCSVLDVATNIEHLKSVKCEVSCKINPILVTLQVSKRFGGRSSKG